MDDYYKGDFYEQALRRWVDENVQKIKTIPNESLDSMRQIILDGYKKGRTIRDISTDIQKEYNVSKHKAQMFARDQVATLNAQITKLQQQDAGCNATAGRHRTMRESVIATDPSTARPLAGTSHRRCGTKQRSPARFIPAGAAIPERITAADV